VSRPLLFIAHSLGGIIVKKVSRHLFISTEIQSLILQQALFGARIKAQYHSLFQNTLGIVFLSTLHQKSEIVSYVNILANVAAVIMHKPNSCLISALHINSLELLQLTFKFRHQLLNYQVVSFYKMKSMKLFSSLVSQCVVDRRSSVNPLIQFRLLRNTLHS